MSSMKVVTENTLRYLWTKMKSIFVTYKDLETLSDQLIDEPQLNQRLINYVLKSTKVNGYALNSDINLTASDVGACTEEMAADLAFEIVHELFPRLITQTNHLKRLIVGELPDENIDTNTIYMVLDDSSSSDNKYIEWMCINGVWEKTGDTSVDLTDYMKTSDLVEIQNAEIDTIIAS